MTVVLLVVIAAALVFLAYDIPRFLGELRRRMNEPEDK